MYRRAGQIITGATLGSIIGAVAAPGTVAAAGGAAAYAGYLGVRSLIGTSLGSGAGGLAGAGYKNTFGKWAKEDYRKQVRSTIETKDDLKKQQDAEKWGSRANRQKIEKGIQIGTAVAVGGVASFEIGSHFQHLAAVDHARHVLEQHPPAPATHPNSTHSNIHEKPHMHVRHHAVRHEGHSLKRHHQSLDSHTTGSENLGAAPEPNYNDVMQTLQDRARLNSLNATWLDLNARHDALVNSYQTHDPNYAELLKHYDTDLQAYKDNLEAYTSTHAPTPVADVPQTNLEHSAPAPIEQHSTPSSAPEHPAAPVTEAAHSAPAVENIPASVNTLIHTEGWDAMRQLSSMDVFKNVPDVTEKAETLLRDRFLAVVRESGINPVDNQSVQQYMDIATKAIEAKTANP